jgi:hypothetical protein
MLLACPVLAHMPCMPLLRYERWLQQGNEAGYLFGIDASKLSAASNQHTCISLWITTSLMVERN